MSIELSSLAWLLKTPPAMMFRQGPFLAALVENPISPAPGLFDYAFAMIVFTDDDKKQPLLLITSERTGSFARNVTGVTSKEPFLCVFDGHIRENLGADAKWLWKDHFLSVTDHLIRDRLRALAPLQQIPMRSMALASVSSKQSEEVTIRVIDADIKVNSGRVVLTAAAMLAAMLLFPPYVDNNGHATGYCLLFDMPTQTHINISLLILQWIVVTIVAASILWWLKHHGT